MVTHTDRAGRKVTDRAGLGRLGWWGGLCLLPSGFCPLAVTERRVSNGRTPSVSCDAFMHRQPWLLVLAAIVQRHLVASDPHHPVSPSSISAALAGGSSRRLSRDTERPVLLRLYEVTQGASWQRSDSWLSDFACVGTAPFYTTPSWYGVQSCQFGEVQRLLLNANGLRGTVPTEIGMLTALTSSLQLTR